MLTDLSAQLPAIEDQAGSLYSDFKNGDLSIRQLNLDKTALAESVFNEIKNSKDLFVFGRVCSVLELEIIFEATNHFVSLKFNTLRKIPRRDFPNYPSMTFNELIINFNRLTLSSPLYEWQNFQEMIISYRINLLQNRVLLSKASGRNLEAVYGKEA